MGDVAREHAVGHVQALGGRAGDVHPDERPTLPLSVVRTVYIVPGVGVKSPSSTLSVPMSTTLAVHEPRDMMCSQSSVLSLIMKTPKLLGAEPRRSGVTPEPAPARATCPKFGLIAG